MMLESSPTSSSVSSLPSPTVSDPFPFDSFVGFLDDLSFDSPRPPQPLDSPIAILPPELLSVIFNYFTEDDLLNAPIMLTHVCSLWRQTAISTPCLWRTIAVSLPLRSQDITLSRTETWLSRAGLYPVHLTLVVKETEDLFSSGGIGGTGGLRLLECLKRHACHWGSFTLKTASHDIARMLFLYLMRGGDTWIPLPLYRHPERFSMLMRVDLHVGLPVPTFNNDDASIEFNEGDTRAQYDINDLFDSIAAVSPAQLRHLNLAASAIPTFNPASKFHLNLNLTTLQIFERTNMISPPFITPAALLTLVSFCPNLEILTFRGAALLYDPDSIPPNMEECIQLPFLHTLRLAQTAHQHMILSYLAAPKLRILNLVWLNQEGAGPIQEEPPFFIPISAAADPFAVSSLQEEPSEFSQSPWTDILTGTGLRVLIHNSGGSLPHLIVLDMDFADMRSPKDFTWVFSRTPNLEVFRMVGSDMSDRVLNALSRPWRIADESTDWLWLCPRLRQVEFNRCDVITGEGIVNFARARGRNSPFKGNESAATIENFIVEGCSRIECTSVAVAKYLVERDVCFDVNVGRGLSIFSERGITMPS